MADGDTQGFLRSHLGSQPGEIVDDAGDVVGTHDGAYAFTVGQRKNLGIALGERAYVVRLDAATDTAVRSFQSHAGITADGIVGVLTWNALHPATAPPACWDEGRD